MWRQGAIKRERERHFRLSSSFSAEFHKKKLQTKRRRRVGSRLGYFRLPPLQFSLNVGDIKKITATDNDLLRGGRPTIPRFMRHMVISLIKQKWRNHPERKQNRRLLLFFRFVFLFFGFFDLRRTRESPMRAEQRV